MDFFQPPAAPPPVRTVFALPKRCARRRLPPFLLGLFVTLALAALAWLAGPCRAARPAPAARDAPPSLAPASNDWPRGNWPPEPLRFAFPTPRDTLADTNTPGTFMPTVSGRIESALYGLVRTSSRGTPAFHEGLDIAPVSRNRRDEPADPVFAAADGCVGYVNPVAGNSNYGIYIVLLHREPVGEFYTLYAHLAGIEETARPGASVRAGDPIGRMGWTPAGILTPARGHLHFEIGLVQNTRFDAWFRAQNLTPDHGCFNGQNLLGIDPQAIFRDWDGSRRFALLAHLRRAPLAFTLLAETQQPVDFFTRHPALWHGRPFQPGVIAVDVAEGGVPVAGRLAPAEDCAAPEARRLPAVLRVSPDPAAPARRLLSRRPDGAWQLSAAGARWLEVLLY